MSYGKLTEKKKIEIKNYLEKVSNELLLEDTLYLANGDDYDGDFTEYGKYEYMAYIKELVARLIKAGFLDKEVIEANDYFTHWPLG